MAKQNAASKQLTPLQLISQGVPLPPIPSFTDFELHRHWILEHMVSPINQHQLGKKDPNFVMPNIPPYRPEPLEYSLAKATPKE
jgi:hypothetical protein